MRRSIKAIFAAVALFVGGGAFAQSPDALPILLAQNDALQRKDMRVMAQCIVKRHADLIHRIIVEQDPNLATDNGKIVLADADCLRPRFFRNSQVALTPWYFTLLGELLFVERFVGKALPDFASVGALSYQPLTDPDVEGRLPPDMKQIAAFARWQNTVDRAAECAARREGEAVSQLVILRPDSPEERDAVNAIVDRHPQCALRGVIPPPPDFVVRSALAEATYRLTVAASSRSGAK